MSRSTVLIQLRMPAAAQRVFPRQPNHGGVTFCDWRLLECPSTDNKEGTAMQISHHAGRRMNQRGISRRLVDFALRYGRIEGNKHVLDRNESRRLIEALEEELRLAKRVMDKGGITVVEGGDTLVTAYNLSTRARPPLRAPNGEHAHV